ncbi:MAG: hypothetical protein U0232_21670 [Thermomicrobiales bacterium]
MAVGCWSDAGCWSGSQRLWMTLFYPRPDGVGPLLTSLRLLFGSGMVACLVLGVTTIRRGNVVAHRAWMARGCAIGLGAAADADPDGRRTDHRPAGRVEPRAADGCGLGDQPRRGRTGHPQAALPAHPRDISRCCPAALSAGGRPRAQDVQYPARPTLKLGTPRARHDS